MDVKEIMDKLVSETKEVFENVKEKIQSGELKEKANSFISKIKDGLGSKK